MAETVSKESLQRIQNMIQDLLDDKGLPAPVGKSPELLDVPYRSQLGAGADKYNNDCGAASAVMLVEAYTKASISVTSFYERTGATGDQYLNATQIIRTLEMYGVSARWNENLKLCDLYEFLSIDRPVIALLNYKVIRETIKTESTFSGPHFATVVGMDIKHVYIHDPLWKGTGGSGLAIPVHAFRNAWETTPGNSVRSGAIVPTLSLGLPDNSYRAKINTAVLNVREGPGTNYSRNGNGLLMNTIVTVLETKGEWGRIGPSQWIHLGYTVKL